MSEAPPRTLITATEAAAAPNAPGRLSALLLAHGEARAVRLCVVDCRGEALELGQGGTEGLPGAEGVTEALKQPVADCDAEAPPLAEARAVGDEAGE